MLFQVETISFILALIALQVALVLYIWGFIAKARRYEQVSKSPVRLAGPVLLIAWIALTVSLSIRALQTGHVPFVGLYEITAAICWGILLSCLIFQWRTGSEVLGAGGAVITYGLLIYAFTLPSQHTPLPPVLQGTIMLPLHVVSAIIAYGMFAVGFISAVFLIIKEKGMLSLLPEVETLDRAGYLSVLIGLPFMTLTILLGSIWASTAWGSYWSWDPKETSSLVTWLIYFCYLMTRWVLKWPRKHSALILIIGFIAVLVTFFGNLVFSGLHSYAS